MWELHSSADIRELVPRRERLSTKKDDSDVQVNVRVAGEEDASLCFEVVPTWLIPLVVLFTTTNGMRLELNSKKKLALSSPSTRTFNVYVAVVLLRRQSLSTRHQFKYKHRGASASGSVQNQVNGKQNATREGT